MRWFVCVRAGFHSSHCYIYHPHMAANYCVWLCRFHFYVCFAGGCHHTVWTYEFIPVDLWVHTCAPMSSHLCTCEFIPVHLWVHTCGPMSSHLFTCKFTPVDLWVHTCAPTSSHLCTCEFIPVERVCQTPWRPELVQTTQPRSADATRRYCRCLDPRYTAAPGVSVHWIFARPIYI